jgi:putative aminopeptidase FrvX
VEVKPLLKKLCEASGISGYEAEVRELVMADFKPYADEWRVDKMGSVIALKRGYPSGDHRPKIMLAGHMDEIGLIVSKIEKGFLHFTSVGGIDPRVLLGQEVVVHGRRPLPGVIGSRPPHVLPPEEREKVIEMEKLFMDVGLPEEEVLELVQVGDLATIRRDLMELQGDRVAGKALDDRAGVATVLVCFHHLASLRHTWDVYGVATVQEEVGLKGAMTSAYGLAPDIGVAIDVTFGDMPGLSEAETLSLGKGPAIAFGPNVHPKLYEKLVEVAEAQEIPYQVEPVPGRSGTDAWAMQVTREGIPTALIGIPLRYMHTSVETVCVKDIERAGRLLAVFIAQLDEEFLNSLKDI